MSGAAEGLGDFLAGHPVLALVEIAEAKGSTPRERGAFMLVADSAIFGTIGGGQLEFMAIAHARQLLADGGDAAVLDVPLGPEIGQCCGGRVAIEIRRLDVARAQSLLDEARSADQARPTVIIFGGGHVGHALATVFALLPVRTIVVETREEALAGMPAGVESRLAAVPEGSVRDAPPGAAFVVLTHDHALDFLIVAEALARDDAAYVGMIGSRTKKATFGSWYLKTAGGSPAALARLVSPIGGDAVKDKRPEVIAALAAAEILTALWR